MKVSQMEIRNADVALRVAGTRIKMGSISMPARIGSMEDADGVKLAPMECLINRIM